MTISVRSPQVADPSSHIPAYRSGRSSAAEPTVEHPRVRDFATSCATGVPQRRRQAVPAQVRARVQPLLRQLTTGASAVSVPSGRVTATWPRAFTGRTSPASMESTAAMVHDPAIADAHGPRLAAGLSDGCRRADPSGPRCPEGRDMPAHYRARERCEETYANSLRAADSSRTLPACSGARTYGASRLHERPEGCSGFASLGAGSRETRAMPRRLVARPTRPRSRPGRGSRRW